MGDDIAVVEMSSVVTERTEPALRLLDTPLPNESRLLQFATIALAIAIATGFFFFIHHYYAPGPGDIGIDENAYLVGGKQFAEHGTPALQPSSPFAYIGPMWILVADGSFHPKYPVGVPLLNAIAIWIGGSSAAAYYVSPICGAIAVLGMFFCVRPIAGSVCGLLAAILLATNPSVLHLSLVPSSHAPATAFTVLGMVALMYWWRSGRVWLGIVAGLCIGFTVSLRYTEGLLLAPLGLAALTTVYFKQWRSWLVAGVPVLAWCVPFVILLAFNRITMGHWTGYDTTNESTGFTMAQFASKWQFTVQQLHLYGLFFVLPLGLLGMLLMLTSARWWKVGVVMLAWFVPSILLYNAYYWGQNMPGLTYLRFFLTVYPAAIASAVWLVAMVARGAVSAMSDGTAVGGRATVGSYVGATAFTAMVAAVGVYVSLDDLSRLRQLNANLDFSTQKLFDAAPTARPSHDGPPPLMFAEDLGVFSRLLMHFQFAANGEWFSATAFTPRGARQSMLMRIGPGGQGGNDADTPVLIQKTRIQKSQELYKGKLASDLAKLEATTINTAIASGRDVYAILTPASTPEYQDRLRENGLTATILTSWTEPEATAATVATQPARTPTSPAPVDNAGPDAPPPPKPDDRGGLLGRFRPGGGGPNSRRAPGGPGGGGGGPFSRNNDTLIMPAMRIPRFFEASSTLQLLKVTVADSPTTKPSTTATPPTP